MTKSSALFAVLLLSLGTAVQAAPTVNYGGETYALTAIHESHSAKDPTVMLYAAPANTGSEVKTAIEVVHWAKEKYPDELGRRWLEAVYPRSVQKPVVLVSPDNKRDIIYEVITFFQNPSGEEADLRRFFRDPEHGGVTSYLVKWLFLEKDSQVDDSFYRSRRDALIAELRRLTISLDVKMDPNVAPPPAPPAAKN